MSWDIVIQRPADAGCLVLLFHGVGSNANDLVPVGRAIARRLDDAFVVSVSSPDPSDFGGGWQWFSVRGVTESNRPERVAAAMPAFEASVRRWQTEAGLGPDHTVLAGFSQGAIMALESTQRPAPVSSVVASMAGRFAESARRAPANARVHLLHGEADGVMPVAGSIDAAARLSELGGVVTLDLVPELGHEIDARMVDRLLERLVRPSNPRSLKP